MAAIRMTQASALGVPAIRALFLRAIVANKIPYPEGTILELQHRIGEEALGIWVGTDGWKACGVCVAALPTSNFMVAPQVFMAYNEGPARVCREVIAAVREWISEYKFEELIGCNRSDAPDAVWLRAFKTAGAPSQVGTAYKFSWRE